MVRIKNIKPKEILDSQGNLAVEVELGQKQGFTLIELLVVIAIIGILASIIFVNISGVRQKLKNARAAADFRQIEMAARLDYDNNGNWADDVDPGYLPRFADPSQTNPPIYPPASFGWDGIYGGGYTGAEYYCDECTYDWQNWGTNPDCIIIDLYDQDWNTLKRRCISTGGCPEEPCNI